MPETKTAIEIALNRLEQLGQRLGMEMRVMNQRLVDSARAELVEMHRKLQEESAKTGEICVQRMKLTDRLEKIGAAVEMLATDLEDMHNRGDGEHSDEDHHSGFTTARIGTLADRAKMIVSATKQ